MNLTLTRPNGVVLCDRCALADRPLARARGLLGRASLAPGDGLYLATSAIHTWFMRFPIDVVFLDADLRVIRVVEALRPWRIAVARGAKGVVELRAGECARAGLEPGDRLSLGAPVHANGANGANGAGRRLQVVVSTPDARFRRVTAFLLERQGIEARFERDAEAAVALAERVRPDAVLLDGSRSLPDAARGVNRLSALDPSMRVVVVSDEEVATPRTLRVLPKWAPFAEILDELRPAPHDA